MRLGSLLVAPDEPRYLDRRAGRGYTEDPTFKLPGEPKPAPRRSWHQRIYADDI
jgi:hypothetical protein